MRGTDWILLGGLALFVASAALILTATAGGPGRLLWIGIPGITGAALMFGLAALRMHTQVDWERVEAEQRLWESGALGRAWLRVRKRLAGR
jgi:hypothetical protein